MMQKAYLLTTIVAGAFLIGCQAPTGEITAANSALDAARAAEADKYAPAEFAEVQAAIDEATNEISAQDEKFFLARSYGNAEQKLQDAQAKAKAAESTAKANKEAVKLEVEALIVETEQVILTAQTDLQNAPTGKDNRAEVEAMKAEVETLNIAVTEAKDLYSRGDYLGSKTSLTTSKQKAEEIIGEVQTAMSKVRGGRQRS